MLLEPEAAKVRPDGRHRTKARRAETFELAGLELGPLRVGSESLDDAVELARLTQLGHLAQAEQRPVGVLPIHADGLDEGQILVRPLDIGAYATAWDRCTPERWRGRRTL